MSSRKAEYQLWHSMGQPGTWLAGRGRALACISALVLAPGALPAQTTEPSPAVEQQIRQLRSELRQTRGELEQTKDQLQQVLTELRALRRDLVRAPEAGAAPAQPYVSAADIATQPKAVASEPSPGDVQQNQSVLAAQVEEQAQTKVESASKYRLKLSGLILMNAYSNRGPVDLPDLPNRATAAIDKTGIGATFRQSVLGLQVFGPQFAGARTSGSVSVDFFGGVPTAAYGSTTGILRLREAAARFDWKNTSVVVGQQTPFFSPLSPTSYATLAEPALAWAGNLWVWTPQAVVEHRFTTSDKSWFSASGGILLPLTEAISDPQAVNLGPGQRSRRPAFATEFAWNSNAFGQPVLLGIGAYTSHLVYNFGHIVDSWAVTADWKVPLGKRVELSGEGYRGLAVGGLGGGVWQSVAYDGDPNSVFTHLRPLNSLGGWGQVKYRFLPQWETNAAIGQDGAMGRDLEWAANLRNEFGARSTGWNRETFGNVIYRPRSNLLFSVEYRKMWTYSAIGVGKTADQVNVGAGVSF